MLRLNDTQVNNFLAKIMIKNDLIDKTQMTPDNFKGDYKIVFKTMKRLRAEGESVDPVTISEEIGSNWIYELCEIHWSYVKYLRCLDGFYDPCCLYCGFSKSCSYCKGDIDGLLV